MSSVPTHPEARHSEAGKAPWHRRLVPAALKRERIGGQAVRFLIVGLSNTAVDLIIFNLLRLIPGMPDVAAKAVSYFCGIVNSFFWNKYWTFNARGTFFVSGWTTCNPMAFPRRVQTARYRASAFLTSGWSS